MLKIAKTTWRPFIELTEVICNPETKEVSESGFKFYLNPLKVPEGILSRDEFTVLIYPDFQVFVKESVKDIFKTIDKMVKDEADRKAKIAMEVQAATEERVKQFGESL